MLQVRRHQPFLLDMWRALSGVTSGIWETVHMEEEFDPPELLVHLAPWQSGLEDVDLTRSLIQDNMSAGYAFVLEGGEPEARRVRKVGCGTCTRQKTTTHWRWLGQWRQ